MSKYSNKNEVLNSILSVLNIGLEVVLALIALGFLIGLWGILN
jgi:Na+-translocating ferredoxin:NAD+ oxidoreductase RnfE subunit